MIGPFEKAVSYVLLFVTLALSSVAVQAQQKDDNLAAALQEARNAGVTETILDRLLALGYEKQVDPATMGNFLTILALCQQENLPLQPFLSKIEEGITKKVPATRIEQVLRNKLADYRFTRALIEKYLKRHGKTEPVSPEYLVRITETLYCSLAREDLEQLLGEFPLAPLPTVVRGAELLASLRQIRFDPNLSEQIVDTGIKQGYFTNEQRDFVRIIAAAKDKGLKDDQIARAALEIIEKMGSQTEFASRLGISAHDLEHRGPQLGKSNPGLANTRNREGFGTTGKGLGEAPSRDGSQAGSSGSGGSGGGSGDGSDTQGSSELAEAEQPEKTESVRFAAAGVVAKIRQADLTLTLEIEKANHLLKDRVGRAVNFFVSENVKVKSEGSESGLFDLGLNDIKAKKSHVRVLGKKLAGDHYLITHIVVAVDQEGQRQKKESSEFEACGMATNIDPSGLTMSLEIEKADRVLSKHIGDTLKFVLSKNVDVQEESPESTVFGLSLNDISAEAGYLRVSGKKLAGGEGVYLVTQIVVVLDK